LGQFSEQKWYFPDMSLARGKVPMRDAGVLESRFAGTICEIAMSSVTVIAFCGVKEKTFQSRKKSRWPEESNHEV
jgi:hypothetical protein